MATEKNDDPYRRPTADIDPEQPDETPAARTPGILEMLLILSSSAFVGGIAFFATCMGTLIPIFRLHALLPLSIRLRPEVRTLSALIAPMVMLVSVYVAFRVGRVIFQNLTASPIDRDS